MERRSSILLEAGAEASRDATFLSFCNDHAGETAEHLELVERLLAARGAAPALANDVREGATAGGLGIAIAMHRDAPARIVAAVYAYEHYEVATYEVLRSMGERTFDGELVGACDRILAEERAAAEALASSLGHVADSMLSGTTIGR